MAQKLFGSSSNSKFSAKRTTSSPSGSKKGKKTRSRLRPLKVFLSILLVLEILYCVGIFSNIPFIVNLRNSYIRTAMSTMSHQWLATAFIPKDIIDDVVTRTNQALENQIGNNSSWDGNSPAESTPVQTEPDTTKPNNAGPAASPDQVKFFEVFHELDQKSMLDYVKKNPETIAKGWDNIYINEAGLDDNGTSIKTTDGEQVLAIDVKNQILLVRVSGSTYRGVLAIAKDPARLTLGLSKGIGSYGQKAGEIAERTGGVLSITASGFLDPGGGGNGGAVTGACMANGETHGNHFGWGKKRVELHEDNRLYIMDAPEPFSDDTTDAAEFWPALIIDGKNALGSDNIFTELNPRACIGQTKDEEILFLVIEGRMASSLGTDAEECVDILMRHNCYQAMNMDGGTSAIMWYDGEYITRCSNSALDAGRYLPNAWVYKKAE